MNIDIKTFANHTGRWVFLVAIATALWLLMEAAVHPLMQAAPLAKTLSALIGYGLVVTLVLFMRWGPFQPFLAPLFDEIAFLAQVAITGKEPAHARDWSGDLVPADPLVRCGAMIAIAIYGGLTFAAIVIAGAMLAGVRH